MSKAMQLVGIIILGIFTLAIIYVMSDVRSTNELDYYLLQEVTEASMYDAVDLSYYRAKGQLKVDRDMFLESFNRRFAESVSNNRDYDIRIVDFNETPPKASIEVKTKTIASFNSERAVVTTRVSGIIETIYDDFVYSRGAYGENSRDNVRPTITYTYVSGNTYQATFKDDFALGAYAIVQLPGVTAFPETYYSQITNWQAINGYKQNFSIDINAESVIGKYLVVRDMAGNWSAEPYPTDYKPYTSSFQYRNGAITVTVCDDREPAGAYIAPKNNPNNRVQTIVKSGTPTKNNNNTCYTMTQSVNLPTGTYIVRAIDNNGQLEEGGFRSFNHTGSYPATAETTTYNASSSTTYYEEQHSPDCSHCYINGHYEGGDYCRSLGVSTTDGCGSCNGPDGACYEIKYSCNSGDTLNGATCTHVEYKCNSGGTPSGTLCVFN